MKAKKEELINMYKQMITIRLFEEATIVMYKEGSMPGLAHPYIGQEGIAVGVCQNLRKDDYIVSNHRGHGHLIAKGGNINLMMAEILGRETGYCKGRGGSMHIADFSLGILGANGIVGGGFGIGVGAALSAKKRKTDQVTVVFFGDASSNEGTFHEALNLASIWKAPVIFVCENNGYGISVSQKQHMNIKDVADRAIGYGMPGVVADGNDVIEVYETFSKALKDARKGNGPTLLEYKTTRWTGHHVGDNNSYRPKGELEEVRKNCCIARFEEILYKENIITPEDSEKIKQEIQEKVNESVKFAKESPMPDPSGLMKYIYA